MSIQLRVGGTWLTDIGGWGELAWSTGADGGCLDASWKMDLPFTFSHPSLRRSKIVEIKTGPVSVYRGVLTEPDVSDDWTFTAQGLSTLGKNFLCFDALGNTTATPDVAIDQAIARGLPWKRPVSLSSTPFNTADATAGLNYVSDLLDAWATSQGKRWGVNTDGEVYATVDPTTPTWHLAPGSGRFGLADDDYSSDLYLRYVASGVGYATAHVGDSVAAGNFGTKEYPVDLTAQGLKTLIQAEAVGAGLLAKGAARLGYTNGVSAAAYQLTTPGGTPASLPLVKGGQLVRMFGVPNEQGQSANYLDWVIGETHLEAGGETIALTPVGLVPRTLQDVLSATGSAA